MAEEKLDNWKQFQGTELGSLMAQLYSNQNKPKINYPKPKQRKDDVLHPQRFSYTGSDPDATDPRKTTKTVVAVKVPKLTGKDASGTQVHAVDLISKRRSADSIKVEIEDIRLKQSHFRPAYIQPISSDAEKDRLSQIFTFKGGKGLPDELLNPIGETPLEAQARTKESERLNAIYARRNPPKKLVAAPIVLNEKEQLKQQIFEEIDERRTYLDEMKASKTKIHNEKAIQGEIAKRLSELAALER
jgi:hypothetical protein